MFAATGRDEYLDEAENTLVNHFFMNQFHTGGFGHRGFTQEIVGGKDWQGWDGKFASENPGCCSMWGQWGLANVARYIVTEHGAAIEVNLYPTADIALPGLGARLIMHGDFPRMREVSLTIYGKRAQTLEFRLRLPKWAQAATIMLNGKMAAPQKDHYRLIFRRKWQSGDLIKIKFESSSRLIHWPKEDSYTVAIFHGPLCLGLSSADANVDAEWKAVVTTDGKLTLNSTGQPVLTGDKGEFAGQLCPLEEDWLAPDVANPHRLRVLFKTTTSQSAGGAFARH